MLRQFCSPIFDLDNMTKSSAYKSEFNFAPKDVLKREQIFFKLLHVSCIYFTSYALQNCLSGVKFRA